MATRDLISPREFWRVLHRIADGQVGAVEAAFLDAIGATAEAIDIAGLLRALAARDIDAAFWALGIEQRMAPALRTSVMRVLGRTVRSAAVATSTLESSGTLRFDLTNPEAIRWAEREAATLVQQVSLSMRQTIRTIVARGFSEGNTPTWMAREIRRDLGLTSKQRQAVENFESMLRAGDPRVLTRALRDHRFDPTIRRALASGEGLSEAQVRQMTARYAERYLRYRAAVIAHNETIKAASEGQQLLWEQAVRDGYLDPARTRRIWILTPDERVCSICRAIVVMNPNGVPLDGMFRSPVGPIRLPGDPHIRCVVADTEVDLRASGALHATSRRRYDGEVLRIQTRRGHRLTCTPNHPILAEGGWIGAHGVDIGSRIISQRCRQRPVAGNPQYQHMPARAEQIADAVRQQAGMCTIPMPIAAGNFHGDGVGSEVEIVRPDGLLWNADDVVSGQQGVDSAFDWRGVRSHYLPLPLCRRHATPFQEFRGLTSLWFNAAFAQAMIDDSSVDVHLLGDAFHRFAGAKQADDVIDINGFTPALLPSRQWPHGNASTSESLIDHGIPDTEFVGDLCAGLAGEIAPDEVVRIDVLSVRCPVFNFETAHGIYLANGIATHNCRCAVGLIFATGAGFEPHPRSLELARWAEAA